MQLHPLGKSDIEISPIIMGTWQAGKEMWAGIDDADSIRAIRSAYEAGITTFDSAEGYGNGHSEQILAKATADVRDRVVYATKVSANHLKYDQVINACHRSLKNLKTDYIDLYQIHWPAGSFGSKNVPISETIGALNELKEKGKIRAIGVSNFSRSQLEEAGQYGRIQSLQPPYSLFWRHFEKDAQSYCREHTITILAYSPMAQGLLTGKFEPDHTFPKGDHRARHKLFQPAHYQRVQQTLSQLHPLAEKKGLSLAQLALAWVISHPGTHAIAGARSAEQAVENAAAADISLTEDEVSQINEIGRMVTEHLDENPIQWGF